MDILIRFLKDKITEKISLEEIVKTFEQMCNIPIENISAEKDMILFEIGTFTTLEEKPLFIFSFLSETIS